MTQIIPWAAQNTVAITDSISDVPTIVSAATQLRDKERAQVLSNFQAQNYEVVASFVWHKTMALLKRQLSTLGNTFIAEMLQRPDIDEYSELGTAISDAEALALASDLGMVSPTQAMRLSHAQKVINHFASVATDDDVGDDENLTPEEALGCLRVCVQGVLGQPRVAVAHDFAKFREKLESETLTMESPELLRLQESPYFFLRTALSILLSLLRSAKGAQLEHAARNTMLIVPGLWSAIKPPERWQVGQAYSREFNDGNKAAVRALQGALLAVHGFDYVPENLRSNTFTKAAHDVIAAHQGMNNFYNEPGPMRALASLGTSIPGPAAAICITAVLCVRLGNEYGVSFSAQSAAKQMLDQISPDRWAFYFNGRLEQDRLVLQKLTADKPCARFISLLEEIDFDAEAINSKGAKDIIRAGLKGDRSKIQAIARPILMRSFNA